MTKRLLLIGLLVLAPAAFGASTALTTKGILYSIDKSGDGTSVLLTRRSSGTKTLLVVPATVDDTRDDRAQLEYDRSADRLYVMWIRGGDKTTDVMMSWLDPDGEWSEALVVSSAPGLARRDELRTAITRTSADAIRTTLVHVASWVRDGENLSGEYSLSAFEAGQHVSTATANFQMLDPHSGQGYADDLEVLTPFPALAISPIGDGIDVVYGHEQGTAVTRLHISPRLEPTARMWKPFGKTAGSMPPAHFASNSTTPVKAIFSRDRVVLYTNDQVFRFVVFERGEWSPAREFALDETLTGDALLDQIRRSIEETLPDEATGVTQ
jgi:hypothetical protein